MSTTDPISREENGKEQVSAEQILQEVYTRRKQLKVKNATKVDILDLEELKEYQGKKRTEFETYLRRNRLDVGQWMRYALFEVEQHDIRRARSVFERALLVNNSYIPLWIRYIDAELKLKCINHARNLLDRAITTLPRVDKLWYKYLFVEESLQNWDVVRSLFRKWCSLEPGINAWKSYVDFETRQNNWNNVREVYSKYVAIHPKVATWLSWVKFEMVHGDVSTIRTVFSLGSDVLNEYEKTDPGFKEDCIEFAIAFANWEASQMEYDRSRAIYKILIDKWPNDGKLQSGMIDFEKQFGDVSTMEESVVYKRKKEYETLLTNSPQDYDLWWMYLDLLEENFPQELLLGFKKSVNNTQPSSNVKDVNWKRYIYLWVRYLAYIELSINDIVSCRNLFKKLINEIIPHKSFTFGKIWIMYSEFEIRQNDIGTARKILGRSLGLCPKPKVFRRYIEIEISLREFDRVRRLYEKFLEFDPSNLKTWIAYAELEQNLDDEERARSIFNILLDDANDVISMSDSSKVIVIKRFIEFETDMEEYNNARELYEHYLQLSNFSPEVWTSYAMYESATPTDDQLKALREKMDENEDEEVDFKIEEVNKERCRAIFERALKYFKEQDDKPKRILMLEALKGYEDEYGDSHTRQETSKRMPQEVKKTCLLYTSRCV